MKVVSQNQRIASDPMNNVWVQANAGTGKTTVLVHRLLRLLFRGNKMGGILCLTYTKAGATEMKNRILSELRSWASMPDVELSEKLIELTDDQKVPSCNDLNRARGLFYQYIDAIDTLKIQTIHGFCQDILKKFPIEAGVTPAFSMISDADQSRLIKEVFHNIINDTSDEYLVESFEKMLCEISSFSFDKLHGVVATLYKSMFVFGNSINYEQYFIETIEKKLGVKIFDRAKIDAFFNNSALGRDRLFFGNYILNNSDLSSLKTVAGLGQALVDFSNKNINFIEYCTNFLKSGRDEITKTHWMKRVLLNGKKYKSDYPELYNFIMEEQDRVFNYQQNLLNIEIISFTKSLFKIANTFAKKYMETKKIRAVLDFDDLILYTQKLFSDPEQMGWVLYQLDSSLQHILVDEAQDTSPEQWNILRAMASEFFSSGTSWSNSRSMFVVGDVKQSIFSFQGADPKSFAESKDVIEQSISQNQYKIDGVSLNESYRTVAPILKTVDDFFSDESIQYLTQFTNYSGHKVFRMGDAGRVEVWPLIYQNQSDDDSDNETIENNNKSIINEYVSLIAQKIDNLIKNEKLKSLDRDILPNDIMILVRNRNPLVQPLVRALKMLEIPVSGVDRIKLNEHAAVIDLINLMRFCLNKNDDYNLACLLKSPLFNFSEPELFEISNSRGKSPLLDVIMDQKPGVYEKLMKILEIADNNRPYSFLINILDSDNNRSKFLKKMGTQAIDPIDEFLNLALTFERTNVGSYENFIEWFQSGQTEIKRDMDQSDGVRILTIHSSKGLEAPIVFLIDTTTMGNGRSGDKPVIPIDNLAWIWLPQNEMMSVIVSELQKSKKSLEIQEYYRLLYVAMTRARDMLYVMGYQKKRSIDPDCWHSSIRRIFKNMNGVTEVLSDKFNNILSDDADKLIYKLESEQKNPIQKNKNIINSDKQDIVFPNWFNNFEKNNNAEEKKSELSLLNTSPDDFFKEVTQASMGIDFGNVVHLILQHHTSGTRLDKNPAFSQIDDKNLAKMQNIINSIDADDQLSQFFGENSLAEVPISGNLNNNFISGRIDRLALGTNSVMFIDFKTDEDKSARINEYKIKMTQYGRLLLSVYPEKQIFGYLLWLHDMELEKIFG